MRRADAHQHCEIAAASTWHGPAHSWWRDGAAHNVAATCAGSSEGAARVSEDFIGAGGEKGRMSVFRYLLHKYMASLTPEFLSLDPSQAVSVGWPSSWTC